MEEKPNNLKKPVPLSPETSSGENLELQTVPQTSTVDNSVLLVRKVPKRYVRPNKSITSDAYRPKPKPGTPTGYEKNVSTSLKSCFKNEQELKKYNDSWRNCTLYEILAEHPNDRGYPCIQDKDCHVGISGDMVKLAENDNDTLEYLANKSNQLYPV